MKVYEFEFGDGTRLTGIGEGPAEAMLDAYHRNGFLPLTNMIRGVVVTDDSVLKSSSPPTPTDDSDPGEPPTMPRKKAHR